jgi:hypothetical protein
MVDKPRQDSSRDLLEELEDGWGTPAAPAVAQTKAVPAAPGSNPSLSEVDEGWLDDLFGDEEESEEEEEAEEPEPELPDERLDPEAFAVAKKARDDRAAQRKDRKRAKAEAKKNRQKARVAASRQKQKAKKNRPPPSARSVTSNKRSREVRESDPSALESASSEEDEAADLVAAGLPPPRPRSRPATGARRPNTIASIKLLAIVLAVLVALAAFVAAIMK